MAKVGDTAEDDDEVCVTGWSAFMRYLSKGSGEEASRENRAPQPPDQTHFIWTERYDYTELLGLGGFGSVWRAYDKWLDQLVAIKLSFHPLKDEVAILRKMPRDGFVQTYDFFKRDQLEGYSMELLVEPWMTAEGFFSDFWSRVPHLHRSEPERIVARTKAAIQICIQTLSALSNLHGVSYARSERYCHADIKPSNLWVHTGDVCSLIANWNPLENYAVKVGDLGLVKEKGEFHTGMSQGFSSPEQWQGERAMPASDIFSLGRTLLAMLCGDLPSSNYMSPGPDRITTLRSLLSFIPSAFLRDELAELIRHMTFTSKAQRPSAQQAIDRLLGLLPSEEDWKVVEGLSNESAKRGLDARGAASHLYARFAYDAAWKHRSEARLLSIEELLHRLTERGVLRKNGRHFVLS